MKAVFATPTITKPLAPYLGALEASVPLLEAAGWITESVYEIGNPYISAARSLMTRKALDAKADVIIYIDHDLSWNPEDLLCLLQTEGDVVAGTYRFKKDDEEYMGSIVSNSLGTPWVRDDGCIRADRVPAGFLKVTPAAIDRFMGVYPHLCYGPRYAPLIDLFNHGAHNGVWYGEDYAFSRNWIDAGGDIWLVPDLNLCHHSATRAYPGNFHDFLRRQPGGDKWQSST